MSGHLNPSRVEVRERVQSLRGHLGLFSFQNIVPAVESIIQTSSLPELGVRAGRNCRVVGGERGRGSRYLGLADHVAILGDREESGPSWIPLGSAMCPLYPAGASIRAEYWFSARRLCRKTCWAIEQCLRCPGVSATWAWVERADSRAGSSPLATGSGSGRRCGLVFSARQARREPVWADLRLLVTPQAGGQGETRRVNIEVLYRRGGLGGSAQVVGDRPCRGSCASGSRGGRSSDCGARRPELRRSEIVLFAGQNQRPSITVCSPKAERLGLRIGQPLAEAKALLPKAVYLPADVVADRSALCQLALDCQRFSPLVGLEEGAHPESLLCDVTGCTHLWDGEKPISRGRSQLLARARLSHPARTGRHRWGPPGRSLTPRPSRSCPPGMRRRLYRAFPWRRCGCRLSALERLEALGLWTIGDVLRLPRETLASRFGVILPQRLDQALGLLPETFVVRAAEGAAVGRPRVGSAD